MCTVLDSERNMVYAISSKKAFDMFCETLAKHGLAYEDCYRGAFNKWGGWSRNVLKTG